MDRLGDYRPITLFLYFWGWHYYKWLDASAKWSRCFPRRPWNVPVFADKELSTECPYWRNVLSESGGAVVVVRPSVRPPVGQTGSSCYGDFADTHGLCPLLRWCPRRAGIYYNTWSSSSGHILRVLDAEQCLSSGSVLNVFLQTRRPP